MEKKAAQRHLISTSMVCSYVNSVDFGEPVNGRMKSCCVNDLYAELGAHFKTGTVLVVRTTGNSCGYSKEDGFRSLAVAEVKWSRSKPIEGCVCFATGLKYLMI